MHSLTHLSQNVEYLASPATQRPQLKKVSMAISTVRQFNGLL